MTKAFYIALLVVVLLGVGAIALAAQSTFLFKHPKAAGVRVVIGENGGAVVAPEYLNPAAATSADAPKLPRAFLPEKCFDFGVMNPLTEGVHQFKIQNIGTAPLLVDIESTTCKCTVGGLSKKEVEPGGETTVTLQWNTGRNLFFTHGAVVRTNDLLNRKIELVVDGKVRMLVGSDVKELIVPNIEPGQSQEAEFLLYSQLWDELDITRIKCGIPELKWQVTPVEPSTVPELDAKVVRRVRVSVPGSLTSGRFADNLRIYVQRRKPMDSDAPVPESQSEAEFEKEQFELAMHGTVLRRFALFGPAVRSDGVLYLGDIQQGRSKKFIIRGKIRDEERSLGETSIRVTPDFIRATIVERRDEGASGLYELTLEVPASAPVCQFLGSPEGELIIANQHPRLGELKYKLRFAVQP
jgi:hypothetical protein